MQLTDNDAIIAYLLGEQEKLSKPQGRKLERLYFCDDLIRQYGSRQKVVRLMVSKYREQYAGEGRTYSKRTASSDYESTQLVFGSTARHNREYHLDLLIAQIQETRQMAKITKSATAMARCDANYISIIEKFMGDSDVPSYELLQVPDQIFLHKPELLGAKLPDDEKLQQELAKLAEGPRKEPMAMDVNYTEVDDE